MPAPVKLLSIDYIKLSNPFAFSTAYFLQFPTIEKSKEIILQ